MKILAVETSCDETAAAVIKDGKILSDVIASQAKLHLKYGGVVPEVAAREHVLAIIPTIDLALKQAKTKLSDIDRIAVTQGPGLVTSLLVGVDTARALSLALSVPLVPVNHLEAHIYANFVDPVFASGAKQSKNKIASSSSTPRKDDVFPALILIVSGGHTLLVLMKDHSKYEIVGETLDDAAGEAFDKTAKLMGLGYPGGVEISKRAEKGDPQKFKLPRPMLNRPSLDFSFSGLKTAVLYEYLKHKKSDRLVYDMSASVQRAIVDCLIGKLESAIKKYGPKTVMLGGGVAANQLLRKESVELANKYEIAHSIPKFEYCTDNAAMIGLAAYYKLKSKQSIPKQFTVQPQMALV